MCFASTNNCRAEDDVISNSIIDALLKTKTIIELENLSESSLITGDSISPPYRDLVPRPHKYYVESMVYGSLFERRKSLCIDDWESTRLPSSVIEYFEGSDIIISDSIQEVSEYDFDTYNKCTVNERENLVPTAVYENMEVSGVALYKNNLYVSIQYLISDNFGRVLSNPLQYLYAFNLSKNNSWAPVGGYYREETKEPFIIMDRNFDPQHEFDIPYNILTRIIPYSYSKFQSELQKSGKYSHLVNRVLSRRDSTYYPRIKTISRYNDVITHPFYGRIWEDVETFQGLSLNPYRAADALLNYIQVPLSNIDPDIIDSMRPYNGTELKYIMGNQVIKLHGNKLNVSIDYYQCDKLAFANDDKYRFNPQSMVLTPILSYNCLFSYDEKTGDWLFTEDEIKQSHNAQIYARKSEYYY